MIIIDGHRIIFNRYIVNQHIQEDILISIHTLVQKRVSFLSFLRILYLSHPKFHDKNFEHIIDILNNCSSSFHFLYHTHTN